MLYAILIHIGANVYNFDHLTYKDLETCEYHRERVYETFMDITRKNFKVECQRLSNNGKSSSTS
jgi:hypothetical protein